VAVSIQPGSRGSTGWRGGSAGLLYPLLLLGLLLTATEAAALKLEVRVTGVTGELRTNVLALLSIYQERKDSNLTEPRLLALHRLAPDQIRQALAPFGYYRVEVKDTLTRPATPDGTWVADYRIDPGAPVKITAVTYRITGPGANDPAFPKEFPLKVGDVLLDSRYEKAKNDLLHAASSHGYLDYDLVSHQILVNPATNSAVVDLVLDTGPRYVFGPVTFKQDLLNEDLLRRFVRFKPGDPYDPDRLVNLQARLLGTNYFSNVEIVPQKDPTGESLVVPIEVIATRNKANKFRVGGGFATDIGARVSVDWTRRYLNQWGHNFHTMLSLSPALSQLNFDYRIPIRNPLRDYLRINADTSYYDTTTRDGWISFVHFGQSIVTEGGWRRDMGIDYRYENYTINDVEQDAVNELVPNVSWAKTVADDPVYTNNGYRAKFSILGTAAGVISPHSYLSGLIDLKGIKRLTKGLRLIARTDLGATWAGSVADLPASRRFYAGGDQSIRGWGYDALGPDAPVTDETIGGRFLAVGSVELEQVIWGNLSGSIFTDFGNAFDPDYPLQFEQSVGLGLAWRTPIGQIRVAVAFALTKDEGPGTWGLPPARLHIIVGPDL
jgi:translocation and assembly module TamA